jgi:uncharacterized protein YdaU (DUF1376 family)
VPRRGCKVDVWMPWYVRDFLAATAGLDAVTGWAYTRLLNHMWSEHGYLPNDPVVLAQLGHVEISAWPAVWERLSKFFRIKGGKLCQKKQLEVLAESIRLKKARSKGGKKGANSRWSKAAPQDGSVIAEPLANGCSSPSPSPSPAEIGSEGERSASRPPVPDRLFDWVLSAFRTTWHRRYGEEYIPTPAEKASLGRILATLPPERIAALPLCFSRYLADQGRFVAEEKRHSLSWFLRDDGVNKYRVQARPVVSIKEARTAAALSRFVNGGNHGGPTG